MGSRLSLLRFLRPYRRWAILAPAFMALEVAMDLMMPKLVQGIVDRAIATSDQTLVLQYGAAMLGATLIALVGGIACSINAVIAAQSFGTDLRRALYQKVQSLSFGNLDKSETGTLVTRLTNDVTQVQDMVLMVLRGMVRAPLLLFGSLIMATITSPRLAVLFFVLIPLVLGFLIFIVRRTYPIFGEVQRRLDGLNTRLQENLAGVRVVKAFARSEFERQRFGETNANLRDKNVVTARFGAVTGPFMTLTLNAGVVAALWIGGNHVSQGDMSVGQIIAFVNYLTQTLVSLMFVSMLVTQFSRAGASAERIEQVFQTEATVPPATATSFPSLGQGRVAFENVSFRYEDGEDVLCDVSFVAEPGQTLAILGATGSGKSTLVNLIPRFYDPSSGRVTLDGVDLRNIDETQLRRRVAVVLQESVLFSGTIRDNIRYGKPDASDEEVAEASRIAQAEEFIARFPEGYDTIVGQRGVNLSGGQKQRLAIARALLVRAEVLILDDSTSAVDVRTEAKIQEGMSHLAEGQTRIIVAQRIRSVMNAEKILVLDDGKLVAQGTHSELLRDSAVYREISQSQTPKTEEVAHANA
ncbi:ABC transporter ATP-binding protein [bacterium]|nr:MAG: ABC transporter ATP-binding protein [bacterium]